MQSSITSLIATSHRLKKLTAYALCLLFLAGMGWIGCERLLNPERPKGAAHSRTDIAARALRIGTALNGSARLLAPPIFLEDHSHVMPLGAPTRKVWTVFCEAGNQQLNMVFEDKSGRLVCAIMNDIVFEQAHTVLRPPVKTPAEAAALAVARLKTLEVLPQGVQIALQGTPKERDAQTQWDTTWLARTSPTGAPYTIKLSLNKSTGLPSRMTDTRPAL